MTFYVGDPDCCIIAQFDDEPSVRTFAEAHNLSAQFSKPFADTFVFTYPKAYDEWLDRVEDGEIPVITNVLQNDEDFSFAIEKYSTLIQARIDCGEIIAVNPDVWVLSNLQKPGSKARFRESLMAELRDVRVLVPLASYRKRFLGVFAPAK